MKPEAFVPPPALSESMILPERYTDPSNPPRLNVNCRLETAAAAAARNSTFVLRTPAPCAKWGVTPACSALPASAIGPEKASAKQPSVDDPNEYELAARFTCNCSGPLVNPL